MEYFYCTVLLRSEYEFWTADLRKVFGQIDMYTSANEKKAEARKKAEEERQNKENGKSKQKLKVLD